MRIVISLIICIVSFSIFANSYIGTQVFVDEVQKKSFKDYKVAAINGNEFAQVIVGLMYLEGSETIQSDTEAAKWLYLSALQDNVFAQHAMGVLYDTGRGVTKDHKEAFKWFKLSSEHGLAIAQHTLGLMYASGDGVEKNNVLAYVWLDMAVMNENKDSSKSRQSVMEKMTEAELITAKNISKKCVKSGYKKCNTKDE